MYPKTDACVALKQSIGSLWAALYDAHPQAHWPGGVQLKKHVGMPSEGQVVLFRCSAHHPPFSDLNAGFSPQAFAPQAVEVDASVAQFGLDRSEAPIGDGVALAAVAATTFGPFCTHHPAVACRVNTCDPREGRHRAGAADPCQRLLDVSGDMGGRNALVKLDIDSGHVPGGFVPFTLLESEGFPSSGRLL